MITLSEAARQPNAPSQPALYKLTKKSPPPGFLVHTDKGWRVDEGSAAWRDYLERARVKRAPQIGGNAVKSAKAESNAKPDSNVEGGVNDGTQMTVQEAAGYKIIQNARREKINADLDEIKLNEAKGFFVDKGEAEYWFSFFQRGITETFSSVRRTMPEIKRLLLLNDDITAEKYLNINIKASFERSVEALRSAIAGEIGSENE